MNLLKRNNQIIITDDYNPLPDNIVSAVRWMLRRERVADPELEDMCVTGTIDALVRRYPGHDLTAEQVSEWMPLDRLFELYDGDDPPGVKAASALGRYLARLPGTDIHFPLSKPPGRRALRAHRDNTTPFLMTAIRLSLHHRQTA